MRFCNFCAKNSDQVEQINEDIVKFLLEDKETLICKECLKQLKTCYEFVQQMKDSENKLKRGKEIKTEHDYFETTRKDVVNRLVNANVSVNYNSFIEDEKDVTKPNLNFKPIFPKTGLAKENKKVKKPLDTKARLYKCLKCTESFKSFKHLNEHDKEFCKNRIFKYLKVCKFCHYSYAEENSLNSHMSSKHAQGEYLCCLCQDKLFKSKGYLSRHIQKVHQHDSLKFFCGECTDFLCLSSQEELRQHFVNTHSHEPTKSAIENQTQAALNDDDMDFEMQEEFLDEFLLAHTNENSFQFSECWEALDLHFSDMLQASAANLSDEQEFKVAFSCPKCYEQFKNPQPLLKHLADIHDLPVLICRVCSKCFSSFKNFKRHKLQRCFKNSTLHSITLECPYCSKIFQKHANFKQHLRIVHSQLRKHICQLCDKQFSTLDHLKKHVLSQHQNERKHVCTVCCKSFTQICHLKQHFQIHTTGKTLQCSECSLKFWRKIDLERHLQKKHL